MQPTGYFYKQKYKKEKSMEDSDGGKKRSIKTLNCKEVPLDKNKSLQVYLTLLKFVITVQKFSKNFLKKY